MQRIKFDVFKTFFEKDLTSREIDFIISLSHYQDNTGLVHGMSYKKMMDETGMCAQSFYDSMHSLERKGVIRCLNGQNDYDIEILGNDFTVYSKQDYNAGEVKYIHTGCALFHQKSFRRLKPKQKLLVMDIFNIIMASAANKKHGYMIGTDKFIDKYANTRKNGWKGKLDISKRTLQKYLKMLRLYFTIFIRKGIYHFVINENMTRKSGKETEKEACAKHLVETACRRNKIKLVDEKEKKDIVTYLTYKEKELLDQPGIVDEIVEKMLEIINQKIGDVRKWERRIKSSLFKKLFKETVVVA